MVDHRVAGRLIVFGHQLAHFGDRLGALRILEVARQPNRQRTHAPKVAGAAVRGRGTWVARARSAALDRLASSSATTCLQFRPTGQLQVPDARTTVPLESCWKVTVTSYGRAWVPPTCDSTPRGE